MQLGYTRHHRPKSTHGEKQKHGINNAFINQCHLIHLEENGISWMVRLLQKLQRFFTRRPRYSGTMAPANGLQSLRYSMRRVPASHGKTVVSRAAGPIDLARAAGYNSFDDSYEVRTLRRRFTCFLTPAYTCYCATVLTDLSAFAFAALSASAVHIHNFEFAPLRHLIKQNLTVHSIL